MANLFQFEAPVSIGIVLLVHAPETWTSLFLGCYAVAVTVLQWKDAIHELQQTFGIEDAAGAKPTPIAFALGPLSMWPSEATKSLTAVYFNH